MLRIAVNTRVLNAPTTGVQRYTTALLKRWESNVDSMHPQIPLYGLAGHAWEQFILPRRLRGRLLFSPSNTGPLEFSRQVLTIHDMSTFDCPENFSPRFIAWYKFLLPRLARRVQLIITDSKFVKDRILAHIPINPEKVVVVPLGVEARFHPQAISQLSEAISALQLPSLKYVLTVGSVEPRKNLPRLLEAWTKAQKRLPNDLWLLIVGTSGDQRIFSGVQIDELPPRVMLLGHVSEKWLPSLYAGAIVTVYVSLYEGFGLPVIESMACGTPVIAGNRSSMPELVGEAGMLVDPSDADEIAEGICSIVENDALREQLRERGLSRAQGFSWDATANNTWQILTALAQA